MRLSVSSILISLSLATVLIIVLYFLLNDKRVYKKFRISFLSIFSIIISLRLFFPFEFINTHTVASHKLLPALYSVGKTNIYFVYNSFQISEIFIFIWLLGTSVMLIRLIVNLFQIRNFLKPLKDLPSGYLSSNVQKIIPSKVKVKSISSNESPFAWGIIRPMIAMPLYQFDEVDQRNIIMHELEHINSYDALKKFLIEVLVCLYWWFPLIYVFKDQVTLILEMNVDCRIVKDFSKKSYFDYIRSLINIAEFSSCSKTRVKQREHCSNFVIDEGSTLKKRESFLLEEYSIKRTKCPLVIILVVMPLLLTSIIIEPYKVNNKKVENAFKIDPNDTNTYILKKDNRYELIVKGKKVGKVRNLNKIKSPIIKQIPIKRMRNNNE